MKVCVPEISWHNCEPVYTIHVCPTMGTNGCYHVATGAADRLVRIWRLYFETVQAVTNPVQVNFVAEFTVHQASVNAVRFSPNGKYLISGSDDRSLVLWEVGSFDVKLSADDDEQCDSRDIWPVKKILRGHLEGVYDLSWSPCSTKVASASVDNSVIVWDVTTGNKLIVLRDARSYVQGVAWDPKNEFIVTLSSDRHARFYSVAKSFQCVSRLHQAAPTTGSVVASTPAPPLFADDMVTRSFFRRAAFSPDGRFVILSGGVVEIPNASKVVSIEKEKDKETSNSKVPTPTPTPTPTNGSSASMVTTSTRHAAHLVVIPSTGRPGKPILSWPSPRRAIIAASFCPLTFEANLSGPKKRDVEGVPIVSVTHKLKTRRRFVAALVAADALILVETSRTCRPIGYIGGLHLDQLTDASWSADGRLLIASSTDGYCTLAIFGQNELGVPLAACSSAEKPCEPVSTKVNPNGGKEQTNSVQLQKDDQPLETVTKAVQSSENASGKRRIAPLLVGPKEESPVVMSSAAFFGLESSKSLPAKEGSSSNSCAAEMEVDLSEPTKTEQVTSKVDSKTTAPAAASQVNVLLPRRVALTTVSSLPGSSVEANSTS